MSEPYLAPATDQDVQPHACVRCQNRKVKCDKLTPRCTKCIKASVECEYRAPAPPRRGKRKLSEDDLHSRLRYMEAVMRRHGMEIDKESGLVVSATSPGRKLKYGHEGPYSPSPKPEGYSQHVEKAYASRAKSPHEITRDEAIDRFAERHNPLWQELEDLDENSRTQASSDDDGHQGQPAGGIGEELILGMPGGNVDESLRIPSPESCSKLWQIFQENWNALSRTVHVPSTDPLIAEAMSIDPRLSNGDRALLFSIFLAAVTTINNHDCEKKFAETKDVLLERYRLAAKQSFVKAGVLSTSDLKVLQAFTIFIISCHQAIGPEAHWTLNGVAVRIGLRLGLHRKDIEDLTPFEVEMRSRLWWQICIYDTQLAEVAGQKAMRVELLDDMDIPLNVNDADLDPDMTEAPRDREGATEMMFSRVRYEFATFIRQGGLNKFFHVDPIESADMRAVMAEKDRIIDELEKKFEDGYLRYCDPLVPLQFLSTILARCVIARLRLMAHHPRQYTDKGASLPNSEKEMLYSLSLKALEYDSIVESTPNLKGFTWHTKNQVQWMALVHVLSDLRRRTSGLEAERGWRQVEQIYQNHPEMMNLRQRPIFRALATLITSAWRMREAEHLRRYGTALAPLGFVSELMAKRKPHKQAPTVRDSVGADSAYFTSSTPANEESSTNVTNDLGDFIPGDFDPLQDFSPVNWNEWDDLVRDFEMQGTQSTFG